MSKNFFFQNVEIASSPGTKKNTVCPGVQNSVFFGAGRLAMTGGDYIYPKLSVETIPHLIRTYRLDTWPKSTLLSLFIFYLDLSLGEI